MLTLYRDAHYPKNDPNQALEMWSQKEHFTHYFTFLYHDQRHKNLELFRQLIAMTKKFNDTYYAMYALNVYQEDCEHNPDQHPEADKVVTYIQRISAEMQQANPDYTKILDDMANDYKGNLKSHQIREAILIGAAVLFVLCMMTMPAAAFSPAAFPIIMTIAAIMISTIVFASILSAYHFEGKANRVMSFFNETQKLLAPPESNSATGAIEQIANGKK